MITDEEIKQVSKEMRKKLISFIGEEYFIF